MSNKKSVAKRQKKFNDDWLELDEFKGWLNKVDGDNTRFKCTVCRKTLSLSSAGKSAVTEHGGGNSHQKMMQSQEKRNNFFKPVDKKQGKLTDSTTVTEKVKTKALVVWLLKCIESGYSNNSSDDIVECVKTMCPDSKIADSLKMKKTKAAYMVNHGLAPYFKEILLKDINASDILVISFDESLNDVVQKSEMAIIIRYWSFKDNTVKARYLNSTFMGHGKESDLVKHFNIGTSDIERYKVYQISMDGPHVNIAFFKAIKKDWEKTLVHKLIDIGTCNLHIVSGAFKTGAKSTGWNLDKTLRGSYQIFHDTPARREDYELVNDGFNTYPKFFIATRWVENQDVADTLLKVYGCIRKTYEWWTKEKGRQPTDKPSKSMINVKAALDDVLTEAKLQYFSFLAGKLHPFLLKYQATKPMIPFMYRDLKLLIKNLLQLIVKGTTMAKANSGKQLHEIDRTEDSDNMLPSKDIEVGFAAEHSLKKLLQKDEITTKQAKEFREDSKKFVSSVVDKIFERSPTDSVIVRTAPMFDPVNLAVVSKDVLQKSLKSLLNELVELKIVSPSHGDKALLEFTNFYDDVVILERDAFRKFSENDTQVDTFFFSEQIGMQKYQHLSFVLRLILTLSHGQSDIERNFSLKNNLEQDNQSEDTIIARRLIKDHMVSHSMKPFDIVIDEPLMLAMKKARMMYGKHLEEKKKSEEAATVVTDEMKAEEERKEALAQVDRDLKVFQTGVATAEKLITESSVSFQNLMKQKNMNRSKLEDSSAKLEMAVKRKKELELEIEVLTKKKQRMINDGLK